MQWTGEVIGPPEPELCPLLSESSYLAGQATHNDFLRKEQKIFRQTIVPLIYETFFLVVV